MLSEQSDYVSLDVRERFIHGPIISRRFRRALRKRPIAGSAQNGNQPQLVEKAYEITQVLQTLDAIPVSLKL